MEGKIVLFSSHLICIRDFAHSFRMFCQPLRNQTYSFLFICTISVLELITSHCVDECDVKICKTDSPVF
jgi:hypothetical protein